jgi:ABC-2 type transport system permease protein
VSLNLNLHRIWSIVQKEFLHLRRDPYSMVLILLEPIVLLLTTAYALSTDVKHISAVVWDQSRSAESRTFVESFEQTGYFDVNYIAGSQAEFARLIDGGQAKVGLIIPPDYAQQINRSEGANALFLVDGSDPTVARSALAYAVLIAQANAAELMAARLGNGDLVLPIDLRSRVWYNPDMKNLIFLAPGLVALILQFVTLAMSAFAIVREREHGTMEQLMVTPITPAELMIGKLLPYIVVSLADVVLLISVAALFFGVPMRGSLLLLLALSVVFLVSVLGTGLFVSTISQTQYQALQWVIFIIVPPVLLSGLIFPIEAMPQATQYMAQIMPLTYFLEIVRGIMLTGNTFAHLWTQTLILGVYGIGMLALSVLRFHNHL